MMASTRGSLLIWGIVLAGFATTIALAALEAARADQGGPHEVETRAEVGGSTTPCSPVFESDGDGYLDSLECHVGTDSSQLCAGSFAENDEDPDSRPSDFNDDRQMTGFDLSAVGASIGLTVPPAPVRKDIAPPPYGDDAVSGQDLSQLAMDIGLQC